MAVPRTSSIEGEAEPCDYRTGRDGCSLRPAHQISPAMERLVVEKLCANCNVAEKWLPYSNHLYLCHTTARQISLPRLDRSYGLSIGNQSLDYVGHCVGMDLLAIHTAWSPQSVSSSSKHARGHLTTHTDSTDAPLTH